MPSFDLAKQDLSDGKTPSFAKQDFRVNVKRLKTLIGRTLFLA